MKLLGDNGAGYELAQRLEENSVWRAWLGERDYVLLQSYLATPGTWSAFMQIENPSVTALQLRVRALLFDKALVFLHLKSAATSPPSALDNSFLQLHADNVYFTLEHDAEDWTRLQAEKSPSLASLELKHGLDSSENFTRLNEAESGHSGINSRSAKPSQSNHVSSALQASRTHTKTGLSVSGNASDHRTLGELWYTQYLQRDLMNRMNRLARRLAQRGLPFGDQEACLRTPTEMADYVCNQANHRKRRPVFRIDGDLKQSLLSHERSIQGGDDDTPFMPEIQYPVNCVPENAVTARPNTSFDGSSAHGAFLERLDHLRDLSSGLFIRGEDRLPGEVSSHHVRGGALGRGNTLRISHRNELSEEAALQLAEQAVVRMLAAAGFDGIKQAPLRILADFLACHIRKLGSGLRRIVDTYKTECSSAELLKMYTYGAGGSNLPDMMEYVSKTQQQSFQKRRPAPIQMPQPTIQQALVQQQISPHAVSMPLMMPYQHNIQVQQLQPGYERSAKRRQNSSPGESNKGDRFEAVASDTNPGGQIGVESRTSTIGLPQMLSQPLSQGRMSWSSQAPSFVGLSQVHQAPMLQHFKQQPSSLPIPSVQHRFYGKDSRTVKLPSQTHEHADMSVNDSIKHEINYDGEDSQFSPSRRKRKQQQRSWGFHE
ncbi:uncharacterized protein [Physcomitrium patens]|uniref:Bromodomain associated domain-containing protein n=1 Tax=Physcomitrium patens TaxID=3218 RepID=A0A7I4C8Y0_PHYPA|nr:uncharacterized protein LOC112273704 isoform X3 [Physcomitrium patens]|eukprot:XP_024358567.1 uncharacterized protein LOC112273704 isoform X3 [Physcomitrella patens]